MASIAIADLDAKKERDIQDVMRVDIQVDIQDYTVPII